MKHGPLLFNFPFAYAEKAELVDQAPVEKEVMLSPNGLIPTEKIDSPDDSPDDSLDDDSPAESPKEQQVQVETSYFATLIIPHASGISIDKMENDGMNGIYAHIYDINNS